MHDAGKVRGRGVTGRGWEEGGGEDDTGESRIVHDYDDDKKQLQFSTTQHII